ncbi:lysophospholipid acyltransferase family protein [Auritidibacter ignavus]|uniref:lysophospholipid acyltransferase family protein n=1 Tax=Auritidibacter ignavus TaxID=678932 RepID=UPI00109D75BE|nr:lysophospholipid acyltransferase family protein [Auritidibacter ignavus]
MSEPFAERLQFAVAANIVRPLVNVAYGKKWTGTDNLPDGGCIVAANHISQIDPVALGHMLYSHGKLPHFMAKKELFEIPGLKTVLNGLKQIPVDRGGRGQESLRVASEVIDEGGVVIIYPEGTITTDPDYWPMQGKTGVARLALKTGAPVVPVGQWGLHRMLPKRATKPKMWPRTIHQINVGKPLDLSDLRDTTLNSTVLHDTTWRMMTAVTDLVAPLRGKNPPTNQLWNPSRQRYEGPDQALKHARAPRPRNGPAPQHSERRTDDG